MEMHILKRIFERSIDRQRTSTNVWSATFSGLPTLWGRFQTEFFLFWQDIACVG